MAVLKKVPPYFIFGKVFALYCSGKSSAGKMNKKKKIVQWFKNDNFGTIFVYRKSVH